MRLLPFLYSVLAVLEHGKGNKKTPDKAGR